MRGLRYCFAAAAFALTICNASLALPPKGNDEADIKTLEQNLMAAAKAKDVAKVMSFYAPGEKLFVFDVVPPRQYAGFDAYKKDWEDLFAQLQGPMTFDISDLNVTTNGSDLAFSHSIQRATGTFTDGKPLDLTVRVTDVYRKIDGKWLIVHEHVSVPVDIKTGQADLQSKP
jgi:uncharacterized protein (TIGR02246 family)